MKSAMLFIVSAFFARFLAGQFELDSQLISINILKSLNEKNQSYSADLLKV
jgi:hypothetical protein